MHERRSGVAAIGGTLLLVLALMLSLSGPVGAAEEIVVSVAPEEGATLEMRPETVSVTFTGPFDPATTWLMAVGPDGARVDLGAFAFSPAERPETISVPLRAGLAAGRYTMHWNVGMIGEERVRFGHASFTLHEEASNCPASPATEDGPPCGLQPAMAPVGEALEGEGLSVRVELGSTDAGPIDIVATVASLTGEDLTGTQVSIRAFHLEMDHGEFPRVTTLGDDGRVSLENVGMGMGGRWRVAVDLIRPGSEPVTFFFLAHLSE